MTIMTSKFAGRCAGGHRVDAGMTIDYVKGQGVVRCQVCAPDLAGRTPAPRAPSGSGDRAPALAAVPAGPSVEMRVKVQAVRFHKPDGTWTIIQAKADGNLPDDSPVEDGKAFSVVGRLGQCASGDLIDVKGVWENNDRFGIQFKAQLATPVVGGTDASLLKFLQRFPNVGPAIASKIIRHFGGRQAVLDLLETNPGRLVEIEGITPERAEEIGKAYKDAAGAKDTMLFLDGLGLFASQVEAIMEAWGAEAKVTIEDDPYELIQIDGIGFATADKIARERLRFGNDDPRRLAAAVDHILETAEDQGHTFSNFGDILNLKSFG